MKSLTKIVCFGAVLAGMQVASAASPTAAGTPAAAPSTQSSAKKPLVSNVVHDQTTVQNRMEYNGNLVKGRSAIAKKKARPQPPAKP